MSNKLLRHKLIKPHKVAGISCEINPDNTFVWRYCIVEQKGNSIKVLKTGTTSDLADIVREKLSLVPVYLSIEGKGILHKKIKPSGDEPVIYQVIPNALPDNFCVSETTFTDNVYVSVIRRDIVDPILDTIEKSGLSVLHVQAGSFQTIRLFDWFEGLPHTLATANMEYTLSNSENSSISFSKAESAEDVNYKVAGETIPSVYLSPFALALMFILDGEAAIYPPVEKNRDNFLYKRLFVLGGWGVLLFSLIVLMVNYFFYMHYVAKNDELNKQIGNNNPYLIILEDLKKELTQQEEFIKQSGISEKSRFAYYTDRIAATIPAGIHLSGFNLNPPESKIKKEKAINFRKGIILVGGQTPNSVILNDWISALGKLSWVGKVSVVRYLTGQSGSFAEFEVEIELNNPE